MKRIIAIFVVLSVLFTMSSSFADIFETDADNKLIGANTIEFVVPLDEISEIENLITEFNMLKLEESLNNKNNKSKISKVKHKLSSKGVKTGQVKKGVAYGEIAINTTEYGLSTDTNDYDVFEYEVPYNAINEMDKSIASYSSYPGYRLSLVYVSASQDSNYTQSLNVGSTQLAKSNEKTVQYLDRAIDVVVGFSGPQVWVPKTVLGLSLSNILPSEIINSYGEESHAIHVAGTFTKKYVRFLDTDNLYNGGYVTGAVVNKVDMLENHSMIYYSTVTKRLETETKNGIRRTKNHNYYSSQIYDIAWNNYRNYWPMGHYMIGNVKFVTVDGAVDLLKQQRWDSWDSYYDMN